MQTKHSAPAWRVAILLIGAGLLHALSFAPGPLPAWILPFTQIVALAALARYVYLAADARQAAWRGFVFGLTQFTVGIYWLTISMHQYGGLPMPLAIAALILLSAAMAPLPFAFQPMREMVQYHRTRTSDEGLRWLMARLREAAYRS